MFVDDGIEHHPRQPIVLKGRQLRGLVEDEYSYDFSSCGKKEERDREERERER